MRQIEEYIYRTDRGLTDPNAVIVRFLPSYLQADLKTDLKNFMHQGTDYFFLAG